MSGFGFGHGIGRRRPQALALGLGFPPILSLSPSSAWDGTASSGFSVLPSDPVRTSAKPALRMIEPPGQHFTQSLVIGAVAFANDGGTLIRGVDRVRFHLEGETLDVIEPTLNGYRDANGVMRTYWAYWARLHRPPATVGEAHLYVEAIPADATMQKRVIGPYSYHPQHVLHDFSVTVNSAGFGADFATVEAALTYLEAQNAQNPLVTITGGGPYTIHQGAVFYTGGSGWCTITASTPVVFSRPAFVGDSNSDFRPRYDGLRFRGSNITFDLQNVRHLRAEDTRDFWFDGCRIVNSAGRTALWRAGSRPLKAVASGNPYFTEVYFEGLNDVCNTARLVRGCTGKQLLGDFAGDGRCVIYNEVEDLSGADGWLEDVPALQVTYTGSEATATLAKTGGATALQTFTAKWGANTATFQVRNTEAFYNTALGPNYDPTTAGQGYFVQNVADWLNSLPGWSATVLDNTRLAASLSLPELRGLAFTAQNTKYAVLEIVRCFDIHGDFFQHRFDGIEENVIHAFNVGKGMAGQMFFAGSFSPARDFFFIGNAFANVAANGVYLDYRETASQMTRGPHSHVVFAHNTMATQRLTIRPETGYTGDSYCLVANNAQMGIVWTDEEAAFPVVRNNLVDGDYTAPLLSTGTVIGGDYTNKFADSVNGDFTPLGALLVNLKAPVLDRDRAGTLRDVLEPVGAVAIGLPDD